MSSLSCVGIVSDNLGSLLFGETLSLDPCGLPFFLCGMTTSAAGGFASVFRNVNPSWRVSSRDV